MPTEVRGQRTSNLPACPATCDGPSALQDRVLGHLQTIKLLLAINVLLTVLILVSI